MSQEMGAALATWGPIIVMVAIFYFLLYKPQKKEQQRRKELLDNLQRGDKVVTIGGIFGEVAEVAENRVKLKIAPNVAIEMTKAAINGKAGDEVAGSQT